MSIEAFSEFLNSNPGVATKVAACSIFDVVSAIAKGKGFTVSGAELTKHAARATSELSDDQLEAVAGRTWSNKLTSDPGIVQTGVAVPGSTATLYIIVK